MESINDILRMINLRIDDHEDEIIATFRRVASGELEMPETMSADEERSARAIFGYIAEEGPKKVWERLQPTLAAFSTAADDASLDPDFSMLPQWMRIILDADQRTQLRYAVLLLSYALYDEFHYPQPETSVYDISGSPLEKIKWLYRYWFNQLEVAEKSSGLEEFFARQHIELTKGPLQSGTKICTLSCAGDLLAVDVLTPENTPHLFGDITDFYSATDIVSANLESTVDKSRPIGRHQATGQPARMNTSEAMFRKFRDEAKINFFSTATNHAMDWGEQGVLATLDILRRSGAYHSGTAASQAEQDDVVVVEKNGIKISLLAFTFDLNGYKVPTDKPYLVNEVRFNDANPAPDYALIKKQVAAAKRKGADHIIAYCHWGWEFEMYPHVNIVEAAREVVACGVDTILGNHPHVSQPAELIEREGLPPALVIYAFGDFVSYHPESRNSKLAYIVKFQICKYGTEKSFLANFEALPIYILNAKRDDGSYDCRIMKFASILRNPDGYGLTDLEKDQLTHLMHKIWIEILSPLSAIQ